jgi:gas vesicle protein
VGGNKQFRACFVTDVTLPDRSEVASGQTLIKTWSINNCGTEKWPEPTNLVFLRGHRELIPGAQEEFPVQSAKAGETVEASAVIITPVAPGRYTAFFRLADSDRNMFGPRMWVDLIIPSPEGVADDANKSVKAKEGSAAREEAKSLKLAAKEEAKALKMAAKEIKKELRQVAKDAKMALKEARKELKRAGQIDAGTSETSVEGAAEEAKDPTEGSSSPPLSAPLGAAVSVAPVGAVPPSAPAGPGLTPLASAAEALSGGAPPAGAEAAKEKQKSGAFVSKWPIQMVALQNMGFENMELNEELLDKEKGNVQTVCLWLLERMR